MKTQKKLVQYYLKYGKNNSRNFKWLYKKSIELSW